MVHCVCGRGSSQHDPSQRALPSPGEAPASGAIALIDFLIIFLVLIESLETISIFLSLTLQCRRLTQDLITLTYKN